MKVLKADTFRIRVLAVRGLCEGWLKRLVGYRGGGERCARHRVRCSASRSRAYVYYISIVCFCDYIYYCEKPSRAYIVCVDMYVRVRGLGLTAAPSRARHCAPPPAARGLLTLIPAFFYTRHNLVYTYIYYII